jgi:hypothetical protein
MRVISQDGALDIPYEQVVIQRFNGEIYFLNKSLTGIDDLVSDIVIAKYSTEEKAKKAMEMLRIAYENNEFYHHTANSKYFTEVCQVLSSEMFRKSTSEYFQFPAEEELE